MKKVFLTLPLISFNIGKKNPCSIRQYKSIETNIPWGMYCIIAAVEAMPVTN